jgi:hypothetical protein
MLRRSIDRWDQLQVFLKIGYGHTCLLFTSDRTLRVTNAVMINPS